MRDLIVGLSYMHENSIVHRDIKPMNILMDGQGVAKLADFGSAANFPDKESDIMKDSAGTT